MTTKNTSDQKNILFLFSDTGGGHRSAAEAIIEALEELYGNSIHSEMVDIFRDYAPLPINRLPKIYPALVRVPQAWGMGFYLSDGKRRTRAITTGSWPVIRASYKKMLNTHPSDLIVAVHPLGVTNTLRALGRNRPPFITVVTDLVTTHAFWYHKNTDLCIVPTENARLRALRYGLKDEQIRVIGLPVAKEFSRPHADKDLLRNSLGWPRNTIVALLVGGGEGMGPIEQVAYAISDAKLPLTLIVVAGRNEKLRAKLEEFHWSIPIHIYGFVNSMPDYMAASDILLTKAGPGTISEAIINGLPMILYSKLPGQEDGNVSYVTSEGAGVWAPQIDQIIETLNLWIEHPDLLKKAQKACTRIARPQASEQIARIIAKTVGLDPS
jgi:1,2-diacylglycerol 3-beta-galactosyltransferase